jgi:hypothetical protein
MANRSRAWPAVCPQGKLINFGEVGDLGDELIAQRSGCFRCEDRSRLPRLCTDPLGGFRLLEVGRVKFDGHLDQGRRVYQEVRRIEIVFPGNTD